MPNYNLEKQQEIGLAIADLVKDVKPVDTLMALMRSGFITLRALTVADENGNKKERMHKIWNDIFVSLCEDTETK